MPEIPTERRDRIIQLYNEGMTTKEIGEKVGLSNDATRQALRRFRQKGLVGVRAKEGSVKPKKQQAAKPEMRGRGRGRPPDPNSRSREPRTVIFLPGKLRRKLKMLALANDTDQSSIVEAALLEYFERHPVRL